MRNLIPAAALTAIFAAAPASAQEAGDIQLKLFATGVLPDGKILEVVRDDFGLPPLSDVDVSDSYVPTIAAEYFFSPSFSVETICCISPHEVEGRGGLEGAELIDAIVLPATVTAKLHLPLEGGFKPYVGAGPAYFLIFDEDVGEQAAALGVDDVSLSSEFGFALQAGFDLPIGEDGLGFSVDAKRYFIGTDATFSQSETSLIETEHDLDPWVVSAGVSFRF